MNINHTIGKYHLWRSYGEAIHIYDLNHQNQAMYCSMNGTENTLDTGYLPLSCINKEALKPLDSFPPNIQRAVLMMQLGGP